MTPLVAFLPAAALAAWFLGRQAGAVERVSPATKLLKLGLVYSMVLFDLREVVASAAFAVLLLVVTAAAWRRRDARDRVGPWGLPAAAAVGATLLVYLAAPESAAGGGLLTDRLALYPLFAWVLWLAAQPLSPAWRRGAAAAAASISLALLAFHAVRSARINRVLSDYATASAVIEPDTTVLPLSFSDTVTSPAGRRLSSRVFPLAHAGGLLAAGGGVVDLGNYEASTGYFPVAFAPGRNAWDLIGLTHPLDQPPAADFLSFNRRTGGRVDYVVLAQVRPGQRSSPAGRAVFDQLNAAYDPVYSSPLGYAEVYRRKDFRR